MVISLSDSHIPLRALRWGHEVWAITQGSVEKHFSVLEKEIDHSITVGGYANIDTFKFCCVKQFNLSIRERFLRC